MALHWFNPPVPVKTERPGIIRNVNNAEAAGEELMKWTKRGPWWDLAVRVCMAVIFDEMEGPQGIPGCCKRGGDITPPMRTT
ncbi:DUF982 domain-containing protein [Mesorhizobium sp. M0859]|uniref:DUF982 domain-containing protein n=1 Tax=Mesorhizobium sp. M0859 TaxID=2957014 RepID=UPI0033372493